nr:tyrosine/DOPA decarboxylase 5 [Ipomoea batatas]
MMSASSTPQVVYFWILKISGDKDTWLLISLLITFTTSASIRFDRSQVEPGYLRKTLPEDAPNTPEPLENILRNVYKDILPGITHWQSPNFFAYFPCISSTPSILGEILSSGLNVVGFNWISSPAATELESIVMDWFGKLLRLPTSFLFSGDGGGGVIQAATIVHTMASLVVPWITPPPPPEKRKEVGSLNNFPNQSITMLSSSVAAGDAIQLKPTTLRPD